MSWKFNFSLEAFGDHWSLLIIRDILYFGKNTYGEFIESEERISSKIALLVRAVGGIALGIVEYMNKDALT
ncbi:hypothetical protein [Paenibacillus sp. NAIST15-1]|uniref:hypothetical protein n=1 Tax=Paenibacillus sp. NAIST15-1 TaxID=1605994 RepID=UPI00086B5C17|nr:hypothetical protein [Paenibacillus sp. NAIST15-1]GAV12845.1 transcriptional regulator [Paenibacillus sp. NAIST15-1]